MQWYYADKSNQQVATQETELPKLVAAGKIEASTLVWNADMPDWQQASNVLPELFYAAAENSVAPEVSASPYAPPTTLTDAPVIQQSNSTAGLQTASLVCGILSICGSFLLLCFGILPAIPAVICGHLARFKQMKLTQSKQGTGMALAGLILGYIGMAIAILVLVIGIVAYISASSV